MSGLLNNVEKGILHNNFSDFFKLLAQKQILMVAVVFFILKGIFLDLFLLLTDRYWDVLIEHIDQRIYFSLQLFYQVSEV